MARGVFRGFMKMCLAVDRLEKREWDERERPSQTDLSQTGSPEACCEAAEITA